MVSPPHCGDPLSGFVVQGVRERVVRGRLLEENKARVNLFLDDTEPFFEIAHSISVRYFEGKRNSRKNGHGLSHPTVRCRRHLAWPREF